MTSSMIARQVALHFRLNGCCVVAILDLSTVLDKVARSFSSEPLFLCVFLLVLAIKSSVNWKVTTLKRTASSPPSKDGKKHKDEDCLVCCNPATDNVMEYVWCEARLHAKCAKLSEEQCILIGNASRYVVFFCTPCSEALPEALKLFDSFTLMDSRVCNIEKAISNMQTSTL